MNLVDKIFVDPITKSIRFFSKSGVIVNQTVAAQIRGAATSVSAGNIVIFQTVGFDTHGAYSTSTGKYTVPQGQGGIYLLSIVGQNSTGSIRWYAYINGVQDRPIGWTETVSGDGPGVVIVKVKEGDTIDFRSTGTAGVSALCTVSILKVGA